ncbi:hypothetical protein [Methylocystis rosea]|uniref:hypothetical protein n=1 Tax=Methylocystis rosea TaxID=173366 RepID=UPI00058E0539|nr:hypothetical protein [Methylocystis rosea]
MGVLSIAFELRPAEEFLSATWIDYFEDSDEHGPALHQAVHAVRNSSLKVTAKSGFTRGTVADISGACAEKKPRVRFLHEEEPDNRAHAALRHWPQDQLLYEQLADRHWCELHLNKDIP